MLAILETDLPIPLFGRGKVRDTYELGTKLLIIATDRVSAFDVVLPCPIPDKGLVLNQISSFWFKKTKHIVPNHLIQPIDTVKSLRDYLPSKLSQLDYLVGRSMITLKAKLIPVECVVRGYIAGSAWAEYKKTSTISGMRLPKGLEQSQELPQPLFTPTTKAMTGHDEPLNEQELEKLVGKRMACEIEEKSLAIYQYGREYAKARGIIIADTKFEFGLVDGKLVLIDELMTPDSSRFWSIEQYAIGRSQSSLDKQPIRDWLEVSGWNKQPPAPMLPQEIIEHTSKIYKAVYQKLVGEELQRYGTN
jgi:phosphoribosylaminoimidazole-succinocarboxamide synthase